ncbi:hypothetical protein Taro_023514 [Colocasia esculenta]|uniref:Ubiquitin-like protease family profile domain-containing protein n=1 Tax=Colocasia esculenta TaxID=4460 RepID=A0A843V4C7_COLES|nr:hypothetical protein [Colocasia esculenta]
MSVAFATGLYPSLVGAISPRQDFAEHIFNKYIRIVTRLKIKNLLKLSFHRFILLQALNLSQDLRHLLEALCAFGKCTKPRLPALSTRHSSMSYRFNGPCHVSTELCRCFARLASAKRRTVASTPLRFGNMTQCHDAKVWFLEHTRLRQPIDREAIPRLFRWGSVLDKKLSFSIDSLQGQQIIKHLKLASKEKTAITCVSQEKMHVETEGVAAPPHPALMALLQGLGDEIRLLPKRLEKYKSCNEGHFEALTTAVTTGFNKMEKLISLTSMAQDQPTVGTDAENFVSTQPSLTPAPVAPAYGDASASVLIVDQGIIAPDPVSVVPTTALLSPMSLIKNMKCRDDRQPGIYDQSPFRRLDKASKKCTSYQRKKGKNAMSTLFRFYKQWTCKSEATERQRALVEAFIVEEGYVDHKHIVLNFINNCSLKWSHIWDILWGNMTDDEVIYIVLHAMKVRQREQEALIPNSYHRWEFLGTILGSWIMHTDGSDDDRGHKLHTSLGHENLGCPISDFQFLFFVVHVSNHWFVLSLQLEQRRIVVYNSCRGHPTYDTCARKWEPILKAYLRYEGWIGCFPLLRGESFGFSKTELDIKEMLGFLGQLNKYKPLETEFRFVLDLESGRNPKEFIEDCFSKFSSVGDCSYQRRMNS